MTKKFVSGHNFLGIFPLVAYLPSHLQIHHPDLRFLHPVRLHPFIPMEMRPLERAAPTALLGLIRFQQPPAT